MVYAKAVVVLKGSGAIIPPREFAYIAIQLAKEVSEAPLFDECDRGAFGL